MQMEQWLWQLREEVKKLNELGSLLKNIGCFRPRPSLPSVARPRSSASPTNSDGPSVPMPTSMGERPPQSMSVMATRHPENVGGDHENQAITSDPAGTRQDEEMAANGDKNVTFGVSTADSDRRTSEQGESIDFRLVEHQVQEGLESLEFHLAVLQRSVDQAHINMRIASQEFSSLLKKVLNQQNGFATYLWWLTDLTSFTADSRKPLVRFALFAGGWNCVSRHHPTGNATQRGLFAAWRLLDGILFRTMLWLSCDVALLFKRGLLPSPT